MPFPENGTFDRDCLNHLRKVLEGNEEDQRGALKEELVVQTQCRERAPLGDRFGVQTQSRKAVFSLQSLEVCKQYIEQRHAETEF